MWGDIAIAFLLAFVTAFIATPSTIKLAKKLGAVDSPKDERRINQVAMPRLGGLAVIAGFIVSIVYLLFVMSIEKNINLAQDNLYINLIGFLVGGIIIGITCFIDDVRGLPALIKLFFQIIAATIVVYSGIIINVTEIPILKFLGDNEIYSIILTIGWIVGITNAINLIDGLDRFVYRNNDYIKYITFNNFLA